MSGIHHSAMITCSTSTVLVISYVSEQVCESTSWFYIGVECNLMLRLWINDCLYTVQIWDRSMSSIRMKTAFCMSLTAVKLHLVDVIDCFINWLLSCRLITLTFNFYICMSSDVYTIHNYILFKFVGYTECALMCSLVVTLSLLCWCCLLKITTMHFSLLVTFIKLSG